jgi:gluconokinase
MYSSAKIAWWRENQPDVFQKVKTFVSLKAFVLCRLTGELLEDQATVSGSGLLNANTLDWDDGALSLSGISRDQVAPVVSPTYVIRGIRREISARTGLLPSTRIVVGSSDAAMSSLGSGTINSDQMTVMIGTSGAVRRLIDHPAFDSQQRTFCYYLGNRIWFAGGAINNGGLMLRWFRDNLGERAKQEAIEKGKSAYAVLSEYSAKAPPGADGLLFLPFLAGERSPHWNGNMRGVLLGLSLHHGQAHIIRALMEGVCYRILSVSKPLDELFGVPKEVRVTGGFSRSPLWLQILSNVLGRDLLVLENPEGSVLGAAAFAYHTLGMLDSFTSLLDKNPVSKTIHPEPELHQFYTHEFERYMRIYWKMREEFEPIQTS